MSISRPGPYSSIFDFNEASTDPQELPEHSLPVGPTTPVTTIETRHNLMGQLNRWTGTGRHASVFQNHGWRISADLSILLGDGMPTTILNHGRPSVPGAALRSASALASRGETPRRRARSRIVENGQRDLVGCQPPAARVAFDEVLRGADADPHMTTLSAGDGLLKLPQLRAGTDA
jgi:hypothetical protein